MKSRLVYPTSTFKIPPIKQELSLNKFWNILIDFIKCCLLLQSNYMLVQSGCPTLDWPAAPPKSLLINLSHSMTQKVDLEQSQSSRSFVLLEMSIGASAGGDLTVQDCRQQLAIGQVRYESDFNKRPVFLIYRIHIAYYILFIKSCYRVDVGTSNWSLGKQTTKHKNRFFSLFFFLNFFIPGHSRIMTLI